MIVKLLAEHHLEVLSLKGGCRGSSESTLVKMSNCWISHAAAHVVFSDCIDTLKTTFHDDGNPIDDNNQTLHRFCAKLEFLLQFDMKGAAHFFYNLNVLKSAPSVVKIAISAHVFILNTHRLCFISTYLEN